MEPETSSAADKPIRLFVGSPLEGPARDMLNRFYLEQRTPVEERGNVRYTWTRPQNWHLTWLFMGHVPPAEVSNIVDTLSSVFTGNRRMMIQLERLAYWPSMRKARLLVWEAASNPNIQRLTGRIGRNFPQYREDRDFAPHITVARIKPPKNGEKTLIQVPEDWLSLSQMWHINSLHLYKSTLTPQGALYDSLYQWPL